MEASIPTQRTTEAAQPARAEMSSPDQASSSVPQGLRAWRRKCLTSYPWTYKSVEPVQANTEPGRGSGGDSARKTLHSQTGSTSIPPLIPERRPRQEAFAVGEPQDEQGAS